MGLLLTITKIMGGISTLLTGIIAICLVIPGEQPEKTLQKVVDFIEKLSLKSPKL